MNDESELETKLRYLDEKTSFNHSYRGGTPLLHRPTNESKRFVKCVPMLRRSPGRLQEYAGRSVIICRQGGRFRFAGRKCDAIMLCAARNETSWRYG